MSDAFFSPQISETIFRKLYEQQNRTGLYVVATPIGNIFDISLRALYILQKAKYIFAEDTRQSKKLLNFYGINTRLIACHEYNEIDDTVTSLIQPNEMYALISDAGTPTISDPGYRLVNWCIEHSIDVFPIPGASAFVAGLSVSGLPTDNFAFHGFLPPKVLARKSALENLKNEKMTMIFLESPKRIAATLSEMLQVFGNRRCCVCREITKIFEEYKRGSLTELANYFSENAPVGEFVVIVAGAGDESPTENDFLKELEEILQTESLKNAVRLVHEKYHVSKNLVYKNALEIQQRVK
ncbi:MAG: 16S rRNA (cytidine(1402)-2'-O)-methyltransferase [Alphaproteobacteria bacterium]|nr:16S rRNA (cytidine(1402)-2'-O)-methyltransferase [Alphaproteobacteria bacterium]